MKLSELKKIRKGKKDYSGADLRGANLRGANLSDANLSSSNLSGSKLGHYYISGGSRNDSALFVPSLGKIWAGCWSGTALEFYRACKIKNTPEHGLYISTLKNILHYLSRRGLSK